MLSRTIGSSVHSWPHFAIGGLEVPIASVAFLLIGTRHDGPPHGVADSRVIAQVELNRQHVISCGQKPSRRCAAERLPSGDDPPDLNTRCEGCRDVQAIELDAAADERCTGRRLQSNDDIEAAALEEPGG